MALHSIRSCAAMRRLRHCSPTCSPNRRDARSSTTSRSSRSPLPRNSSRTAHPEPSTAPSMNGCETPSSGRQASLWTPVRREARANPPHRRPLVTRRRLFRELRLVTIAMASVLDHRLMLSRGVLYVHPCLVPHAARAAPVRPAILDRTSHLWHRSTSCAGRDQCLRRGQAPASSWCVRPHPR